MDAERIVRALAAKNAPVEGDFGLCELCEAEFLVHDYEAHETLSRHEPDCPWRLAREWVAANP